MPFLRHFSNSSSGATYDGIARSCEQVPGAGVACLPCNGAIECAANAALRITACSDSPRTVASAGGAGQRFELVPQPQTPPSGTLSTPAPTTPAPSGLLLLRSVLSPTLCLAADGGASVVMSPCDLSSDTQLWRNHSGGALSPASSSASCLDWGSTLPLGPDPDCLVVRGVTVCAGCSGPGTAALGMCNRSLGSADRIRDLVTRLTLEEKAALMSSGPHAVNGVPRLGVPPVPTGEGLHGVVADCQGDVCATSFPHLTAVGATFNRSLFRHLGGVVGVEARGMKAQLNVWGPDVNLARDPRWGRAQEVPGEDPTLTAAFARAYLAGMQHGDGDDDRYLQVISSPKHAWGYDLEDNEPVGRLAFDGNISDQDAVEYYWPVWEAIAPSAGSAMCSYNANNGVAACGDSFFLDTLLRGEYGFTGYVVSDCDSVGDPAFERYIGRRFPNLSTHDKWMAQAAAAVQAGCDFDCGTTYTTFLPGAVRAGLVSEAVVDRSVTRLLSGLFELGMFDPHTAAYSRWGHEHVDTVAHQQLAQQAAEQAITLLERGTAVLPLPASASVAVIGPLANATTGMLSNYHGENRRVLADSPLAALRRRGHVVSYTPGCSVAGNDTAGFAAAVAAAAAAHTAVVFVGLAGEGADEQEGEGDDRHNLQLPGRQTELVRAVLAANPRAAIVLINGGPLDTSGFGDPAAGWALVEAFYPGQAGGTAIARVLYGDVSPSGRLPVTAYSNRLSARRAIGQMSLRAQGGITYLHTELDVIYPFGFGLSYTAFAFEVVSDAALVLPAAALAAHHHRHRRSTAETVPRSPAQYVVKVSNVGRVASAVSVLGFVSSGQKGAPLKQLFDFGRVAMLQPGRSVLVELAVPPAVLGLVDPHGVRAIRPGQYRVTFGVDGAAERRAAVAGLVVTGEPRVLFSLPKLRASHAAKPQSTVVVANNVAEGARLAALLKAPLDRPILNQRSDRMDDAHVDAIVFDFTVFEDTLFPKWRKLFQVRNGDPKKGEFSLKPTSNEGFDVTSLYGASDMVYAMHACGREHA